MLASRNLDIHYIWNRGYATCLKRNANLTVSAFFVASDVIMAGLPLAFIRNMNMPTRNKVVLATLMAAGLFAAAAATVKLSLYKSAINGAEIFTHSLKLATWM
jgi:hypothetical protein